jgi:divalent metal cation (Fe/Co/Zn/Cd) transporter
MTERAHRLDRAMWWWALSVGWAGIAGATALVAGLLSASVALIGFGADSIVDGTASTVLVWRFRSERSGASPADTVERIAAQLVGVILVLVGVYLVVAAIVNLANHTPPRKHHRRRPAHRRISPRAPRSRSRQAPARHTAGQLGAAR